MADFIKAYNKTSLFEGGYVFAKNDRGGETYRGISRVHHPTWVGWAEIDKLKKTEVMGRNTIFPQLEDMVMSFYRNEFWEPISGDTIPDQGLANMLFDCSVLCGQFLAVRHWQDVLDRLIEDTDIDGHFGPQTASNTLKACSSEFFSPAKDLFKYQWITHFYDIAKKRPEQKDFLIGWTTRVLAHC